MKRKVLRAAGFLTILLWAAALAADRFWGPLPDRTPVSYTHLTLPTT